MRSEDKVVAALGGGILALGAAFYLLHPLSFKLGSMAHGPSSLINLWLLSLLLRQFHPRSSSWVSVIGFSLAKWGCLLGGFYLFFRMIPGARAMPLGLALVVLGMSLSALQARGRTGSS